MGRTVCLRRRTCERLWQLRVADRRETAGRRQVRCVRGIAECDEPISTRDTRRNDSVVFVPSFSESRPTPVKKKKKQRPPEGSSLLCNGCNYLQRPGLLVPHVTCCLILSLFLVCVSSSFSTSFQLWLPCPSLLMARWSSASPCWLPISHLPGNSFPIGVPRLCGAGGSLGLRACFAAVWPGPIPSKSSASQCGRQANQLYAIVKYEVLYARPPFRPPAVGQERRKARPAELE